MNKINKLIDKEVQSVNLQSKEEGEALRKALNGITEYNKILFKNI